MAELKDCSELSELETKLYERFKEKKTIELHQLTDKERGALGKLFSKGLIEKTIVPRPLTGPRLTFKAVWKLTTKT